MTVLTLADLTPDLDDGVPVDDNAEPDDAGVGNHDETGRDAGAGQLTASLLGPMIAAGRELTVPDVADGVFRGHRTRAQLKLRPPRSRSFRLDSVGTGKHWGGGPARIDPDLGGHAKCEETWRGWQGFHMDTHRWVDLAYSVGGCDHGYLLAGRGAKVRTAANGTTAANGAYHAFVWIGGYGETPTAHALAAYAEWLRVLDEAGLGDAQVPHNRWRQTSCAGPFWTPYEGTPRTTKPTPPDTTPPAPLVWKELNVPSLPVIRKGDRGVLVERLQGLLLAWGYRTFDGDEPDGDWGPRTEAALLAFDKRVGIVSDRYNGPVAAGSHTFTQLLTRGPVSQVGRS